MGFTLEHNCLLVIPDSQISEINMSVGSSFQIEKDGERLYPLNIPFEFCDKNYKYFGKVVVTKISIEKNRTILTGKIVKLFNDQESKVFSDNFISPDNIK